MAEAIAKNIPGKKMDSDYSAVYFSLYLWFYG